MFLVLPSSSLLSPNAKCQISLYYIFCSIFNQNQKSNSKNKKPSKYEKEEGGKASSLKHSLFTHNFIDMRCARSSTFTIRNSQYKYILQKRFFSPPHFKCNVSNFHCLNLLYHYILYTHAFIVYILLFRLQLAVQIGVDIFGACFMSHMLKFSTDFGWTWFWFWFWA